MSEQNVVRVSMDRGHDVLFVDLNNFASFPTLAVGILVAALRNAGHRVRLLVPLAYDVPATVREKRDRWWHHLQRRVHLSTAPGTIAILEWIRRVYYWHQRRSHPVVIREVQRALAVKPDILLLSAYLQHYPTVVALCRIAKAHGVPVLLGGAAFNLERTAAEWQSIDGLTAVFGGEADLVVPDLVATIVEGGDLLRHRGVRLPDGRGSTQAPPLRQLDQSPVPDFFDFPWDRYPVRIIPIMTGRRCQWARCLFCSDVVSASGRTFRTRSLSMVLHEMREQARRFNTSNFLFLDLKLNSNPHLLRGLVDNIQAEVPGAQWIGTVHVDLRKDNGLSRVELRAAANSGMRRVSFGLESGSQRLLDMMEKGASVEANESFIQDCSEAGISVRCTMFKGFPGETPDDLWRTAAFLERNRRQIDRVRFNDFSVLEDTPIWHAITSGDAKFRDIKVRGFDNRNARVRYMRNGAGEREYRRAKARVLSAVFEINRRPLRDEARMFDGLM